MGYRFCLSNRRPDAAELYVMGWASNWSEGDTPRYDCIPETLNRLEQMIAKLPPHVTDIDVRINCVGGASLIAFGLVAFLRHSRFRIVTSIENWAFSAGATLSQAGHVRRMASDGVLMAHPAICYFNLSLVPSGCFVFTAHELRKLAGMLERDDTRIEQIFTKRSGRDVGEIREVFERYLNGEEALALNLVDEIFEAQEPLPLGNFEHVKHKDEREQLAVKAKAALARRSPEFLAAYGTTATAAATVGAGT